ncbi:MAG TPA: hypothetical protein VJH87_01750, partial [Vicinamibacteria bacterium]|nr:hypothetical protein [Vicinamibacteria bacterium]
MRIVAFGPAILPLLAAWILFSRAGASRWGRGMVGGFDALSLLLTALLWNAGLGADLFSLFLGASVLGALTFAALTPEPDIESLCRLHLGASLSIVAVSTTELLWSVPAVLLFGLVVRPMRDRLLLFLVPSFAALAGLALVSGADSEGIGLILIAAGLSTSWLVVSREVMRSSTSGLVTRMAVSFTLLVALSSVHLRIAAWFPETAPLGTIHALGLGALGLGALGALGATRITTFLTALALARGGLVLVAHLGGVQGRAPSLMELAASGVSFLLLAAALDKTDTVDDVSNLRSVPRRLVLTLGALSAPSFPPFPGFVAAFPLSSALVEQGYSFSLLAVAVLLFLLALGSMRVVARAWASGRTREVET